MPNLRLMLWTLAPLVLALTGCQAPTQVTMPIASWPGYE